MRTLFTAALILMTASLGATQPPPKQALDVPVVRYGVVYRPKGLPQATPKQALDSVITAAEKGEFAYLTAHLIEPGLIDARVNERTRQFEGPVEDELALLRAKQQPVLDQILPEARVPSDVPRFKALVSVRSRERAFRQVTLDVQAQMTEDPEGLKDLRRTLRWGTFPTGAADATFKQPVPDPRNPTMMLKDRAVYLKKIDDRWFIENRQMDDGRAPETKPPEDKKP